MRQFLLILGHFCFFAPLLTPKIKIWKKRKKTPGQFLLHMCTINQDHMVYGFWDIKLNRQNFVVISGNFLPFYTPPLPPPLLLTLWKMKISKMKKNAKSSSKISPFYTSVPKIMICYTVPEIWCMRDVIFIFILGYHTFFQALFYNR